VLDDQTLIAGIAHGDQEALHQLYTRFAPRLRRYLWHHLRGDMSTVEETIQDVFFAVWRSAGRYRGEAGVATWLFHIAHNAARDVQRDVARRPEGHLLPLPNDDAGVSSTLSARDSEDAILTRLTLDTAIRQLAPKQRDVLVLIFQQGFTAEEAAHILDIPSGTVRSRMAAARQRLMEILEPSVPREEV
jgi:RNA polymerase sigma-70 factor, ECF subfamily